MSDWNIKTVLITGGTGFIGAHVAQKLLEKGIRIVLASRSKDKANRFVYSRPEFKHLITPVIIDDFEAARSLENPFVAAAKGVDGIIHVASPFLAEVHDAEAQLIKPAIRGARLVLEAAAANPSVKRVVLTSSFAAVLDANKQPLEDFVYTAEHWNPIAYEEGARGDDVVGYRASKKYAELAAWDFVRKQKSSHFDLVTLCVPMVFGPVVHPLSGVEKLNISNSILRSVAEGKYPLPKSRVPVWIDVRDLAAAHIQGLLVKAAGGQRFVFSSPEKFSYAWAAQIVKEHGLSDKVSEDYSNQEIHPRSYSLDWQTAQKKLLLTFHAFEDTVVDAISQFNEIAAGSYRY